jgi:hypothetical protein
VVVEQVVLAAFLALVVVVVARVGMLLKLTLLSLPTGAKPLHIPLVRVVQVVAGLGPQVLQPQLQVGHLPAEH